MLQTPVFASRVVYVCHTDKEIQEELNLIVDCGGKVADVFINHKIYGRLSAELGLDSRKKIGDFIAKIESGQSSPLKNITSGYHYHTILADSESTLDDIEAELARRGFLAQVDSKIS